MMGRGRGVLGNFLQGSRPRPLLREKFSEYKQLPKGAVRRRKRFEGEKRRRTC